MVGGVHGGDDGEIGREFDGFIWLIIKRHGNISIIDGIFAFTVIVSIKKLEDFAKDCRCVTTVKFFDNEQALLIRLCIRSFENLGKGTKNKFVLQFFLFYALCVFYFFKNGQQLAYEVGIGVVGMEYYADGEAFLDFAFVVFFYIEAFATAWDAVKKDIGRRDDAFGGFVFDF